MKDNKGFKISQYACAVLLIASSIALVAYQVVEIDDVASCASGFISLNSSAMPHPRTVCPDFKETKGFHY